MRRVICIVIAAAVVAACGGTKSTQTGTPCPAGTTPCGTECCGEGQLCEGGTCVDECEGVECGADCCAAGEECTPEGCCLGVRVCMGHCCAVTEHCVEGACSECDRPLCGGVCCAGDQICHSDVCCLPDFVCGDVCCEDGVCEFDECHVDCGDLVRCGEAEECCAVDEVCHFGECTLPGEDCDDVYDCDPGWYCDMYLGACMPEGTTTECEYRPPTGTFSPAGGWQWTGGDVMMTPAVGNLTDDNGDTVIDERDVPDVAFSIFYGSDYHNNGMLYVVSGDTGIEHFHVDSPRVGPGGGIAIADVDDDGVPEISLCRSPSLGNGLVVLTNTGAVQWDPLVGCTEGVGYEHPAVADLEGDGTTEIVVDYTILSGGVFRCSGWTDNLRIPSIYDVDMDGSLDVVGGNRAMDADCMSIYHNTAIPDGMNAIADIDMDDLPDVVNVSGSMWVLEGADGTVKWGPYPIPGGGNGGAPTVADFDGDTYPEIATAGLDYYVVYDPDCSTFRSGDCDSGRSDGILWTQATYDHSSSMTGSSVFDFEGDGAAEVVYGDEQNLRIYRGIDGYVLWSTPNSSGTLFEYPLIVDLDNDDHAEIVVVSNNYAFGSLQGVRVFNDTLDNWVRTRRIWNEHTYHVTNVNEDGSIPVPEVANFTVAGLNNFRQNVQPDGLFNAPDLVPEDTMASHSGCPANLVLSARILNQGSASAPAAIPVAFYQQVSSSTAVLLGVEYTAWPLPPGASEVLSIDFPIPDGGLGVAYDFYVEVDSDGTGEVVPHECHEDNNVSDIFSGFCELIG